MSRAFENYFRYSYAQRMRITIHPAKGEALERIMDMVHLRDEGRSEWRIAFQAPEYLRGTQLLAIENHERDDDHFLFSPEFRKVRRITSAKRGGRIAGTDFTFEDLDIKYASQFELKQEESGESQGYRCLWVRGVPRFDSHYAAMRWCVDTRRDLILEARALDLRGRRVKTLRVDPEKVRRIGDHHLAYLWEMTDEITGSRTQIELTEVHLAPDFPHGTFSIRALESGRKMPILSSYEAH